MIEESWMCVNLSSYDVHNIKFSPLWLCSSIAGVSAGFFSVGVFGVLLVGLLKKPIIPGCPGATMPGALLGPIGWVAILALFASTIFAANSLISASSGRSCLTRATGQAAKNKSHIQLQTISNHHK